MGIKIKIVPIFVFHHSPVPSDYMNEIWTIIVPSKPCNMCLINENNSYYIMNISSSRPYNMCLINEKIGAALQSLGNSRCKKLLQYRQPKYSIVLNIVYLFG